MTSVFKVTGIGLTVERRVAMRPFHLVCSLVATAVVGSLTSPGLAQTLYVTSDRTVANGNPINGTYSSVFVGTDENFQNYPNLRVDITGGTVTQQVRSGVNSTITVLGGSVNRIVGASTSTINIRSGTISAPSSAFDNYSIAGFGSSTINLYGGNVVGNAAEVSEFATLNIYGTGLTAQQYATGQQGNYSGAFYRVNGTLSDGTVLQNFTVFDANDRSSNPGQNFNLVVVPEPGTFALVATALLPLATIIGRRRGRHF